VGGLVAPAVHRGRLAGVPADADARHDANGRLSMRPCAIAAVLLAALAHGALPCAARADGGTVRVWERSGPYPVAVFTSPAPARVGTVDVSVLVQDAGTGEQANGVNITVRAAPRGRLAGAEMLPATTEAATNKLFRAAAVEVTEPGVWEVEVSVDGPGG